MSSFYSEEIQTSFGQLLSFREEIKISATNLDVSTFYNALLATHRVHQAEENEKW